MLELATINNNKMDHNYKLEKKIKILYGVRFNFKTFIVLISYANIK